MLARIADLPRPVTSRDFPEQPLRHATRNLEWLAAKGEIAFIHPGTPGRYGTPAQYGPKDS